MSNSNSRLTHANLILRMGSERPANTTCLTCDLICEGIIPFSATICVPESVNLENRLTSGEVAVGPLNWEKNGDQCSLTYFLSTKLADCSKRFTETFRTRQQANERHRGERLKENLPGAGELRLAAR